jgi:hypothetical protein
MSDVYAGFDFETINKDFFGNDRTAANSVGCNCKSDKSKTLFF